MRALADLTHQPVEMCNQGRFARLRALVSGDIETALALHADDFQLITPIGVALSRSEYLGAIASGQIDYVHWEPGSIDIRLHEDTAPSDTAPNWKSCSAATPCPAPATGTRTSTSERHPAGRSCGLRRHRSAEGRLSAFAHFTGPDHAGRQSKPPGQKLPPGYVPSGRVKHTDHASMMILFASRWPSR